MNVQDLNDLIEARNHVVEAINHLGRIENRTRAAERETIQYFMNELSDWLFCDHGEAGFVPFTRKVLERVER